MPIFASKDHTFTKLIYVGSVVYWFTERPTGTRIGHKGARKELWEARHVDPHLPGPNADIWDWQRLAPAAVPRRLSSSTPTASAATLRLRREQRAMNCATPALVPQCREHAQRVGEPYGIWGGLARQSAR